MSETVGGGPVDLEVDLELDRAHSARMYDYYLGGHTNFPADREAAGRAISVFPAALSAARVNRRFMQRVTRHLATAGMRQFLDVGTGIPTSPNLHEIAQEVAPEARVVYADNDPIVLAHAQALLRGHPAGRTAYCQADVTDPAALLAAPEVRETLDLDRPVALSLIAVLHFVPGEHRAHEIVEHFRAALPAGSTLAVSHVTAEFDPEGVTRATEAYRAAGTPAQARTREEFTRFFDGWELLEPGVVPSHRWRPDPVDGTGNITDAEAACYAAVARKP
ncbi:SAM-dependent methyltransferase [Streptomyces sp. TRM 70361]|uniref:SAM-dependent methyltransferase n=1 Tax=Streptomyces sp. TRM 70361 TaxID=3116553 RepID=UPI002E7ADC60|nr:SAM-dependent methyltransferase [Streptomyces sp. TRM 70361]MEE1940822.1 SAM-dependent methyltransferase [Streptomyces sp. TRM 70361]